MTSLLGSRAFSPAVTGRRGLPPEYISGVSGDDAADFTARKIVSAVETVGLHHYLGFEHEIDYGRPSLALAVVEESRYLIDSLVLAMVNRCEVHLDDFFSKDGEDGVEANRQTLQPIQLDRRHRGRRQALHRPGRLAVRFILARSAHALCITYGRHHYPLQTATGPAGVVVTPEITDICCLEEIVSGGTRCSL